MITKDQQVINSEHLWFGTHLKKQHKQFLEDALTISYAEFEQEFEQIKSKIIEVHKFRTKLINDTVEKTPPFAEKSWQELKRRYTAELSIRKRTNRELRDEVNERFLPDFTEVHRHKLDSDMKQFSMIDFALFPTVAYDAWMEAAEFVTHKDKYEKLSDITKNLHNLELFDISRDTMLKKSADYDGAADRYASFKRSAETARFTQPDANVLSEILALRRKHGEWCVEHRAGNRPNATLADIHEHYGDFYNYTVILYVWIKFSDFANNKYKLMMVK